MASSSTARKSGKVDVHSKKKEKKVKKSSQDTSSKGKTESIDGISTKSKRSSTLYTDSALDKEKDTKHKKVKDKTNKRLDTTGEKEKKHNEINGHDDSSVLLNEKPSKPSKSVPSSPLLKDKGSKDSKKRRHTTKKPHNDDMIYADPFLTKKSLESPKKKRKDRGSKKKDKKLEDKLKKKEKKHKSDTMKVNDGDIKILSKDMNANDDDIKVHSKDIKRNTDKNIDRKSHRNSNRNTPSKVNNKQNDKSEISNNEIKSESHHTDSPLDSNSSKPLLSASTAITPKNSPKLKRHNSSKSRTPSEKITKSIHSPITKSSSRSPSTLPTSNETENPSESNDSSVIASNTNDYPSTPTKLMPHLNIQHDKSKRHSIVVMQGRTLSQSFSGESLLSLRRKVQPGAKIAELAHKFEPTKMLKRPSSSNVQISLSESPTLKSQVTTPKRENQSTPGSPFIYKLEEENTSLKNDICEKKVEILKLCDSLKEKDFIIDSKEKLLHEKDLIIQEKDIIIANLNKSIKENLSSTTSHESIIIEKDKIIDSLKKKANELDEKVSSLSNDNSLLKKKTIELEQSIASLVTERTRQERSKSESQRTLPPVLKKDVSKQIKFNYDQTLKSMLKDLSIYSRKSICLPNFVVELDRRSRIAFEILETEQKYVAGLSILINNWKIPLEEISKLDNKIPESDIQKIFCDGSLESVYYLNRKLCENLEERLSDWTDNDCLGDIFDECAPLMAPYRRFSSKYGEASFHVQHMSETNHRFKKVLSFFDEHSMNYNGLRMGDYLVTPVQRIPRYMLLLRDLLNFTPEDHKDHINLVRAIDKISQTATTINETIRQAESQTRMAAIIQRGGGFENLVRGNQYRRHIYDSTVEVIIDLSERKRYNSKKQYELILFNDILVASCFVSKKSSIHEYSIPTPLLWVIHDIDLIPNEYYTQHIEPLDLKKEQMILLKSPDALWLVAFHNIVDKKTWIDTFVSTIGCPFDALQQGHRNGKYEYTQAPKGVYEGDWYDGEFSGKGVYVRTDGTLFDGDWDHRFKAGFGVVTSGTQTTTGWANNRPSADVEVTNEQLWGSQELNERDWSLLLTGAKDLIYKKNQPIIEQDIENANLYRIKIGRCRVEKNTPNGRKVLGMMGPKSVFGDTSVLPVMKLATASVVSDAETLLQVIEVAILFEVLKTNPILSLKFYRQIAIKLAQRLKSLHTGHVRRPKKKRTSRLLLEEESKEGNFLDKEFRLKFGLPDDEVTIKCSPCILKGVMKKHGTLFVSQRYVCFESHVFGLTTKEVISLSKVTKIEVSKKRELKIATKSKKIYLILENLDEFHSLLVSLCSNSSDTQEEGPEYADPKVLKARKSQKKIFGSSSHEESDFSGGMTKLDWNKVQQGFKCITYKRDEPIITQGTMHHRIYQIAKGRCRIEIQRDSDTQIVGYVEEGALLGEMSFLEDTAATASVISDEDSVDVYVLEGCFINILFVKFPDLAGRFYCYLASVIATRLKEREDAEVDEEKRLTED